MTARQQWDPMKNTGHGRPTGPRGGRPKTDSLPRHECDVKGCGGYLLDDVIPSAAFRLFTPGGRCRVFCSYGCVSRWAIRQELRS